MQVLTREINNGDILLAIQDERALIYATYEGLRPSDYEWDLSDATKEEKEWLQKCLRLNRFVKP